MNQTTTTSETITDIIGKIRAKAKSIEESARGSLKVGEDLNGMPFTESDLESALDLAKAKRKEADRLEAAPGREKATTKKSLVVGDCAKLREALGKLRAALWNNTVIAGKRKFELYEIADAALAASRATAEKSSVADAKFELCNYPEQVLKIGRDFQNKDGFRGAHYDTVKLLCDTIEYQQEQLKTKIEIGDCAKLREALAGLVDGICFHCDLSGDCKGVPCEKLQKAKAALAEPPRNCDMPLVADGPATNNADRAWLAFRRQNHDAYFDVPWLMRCIDWLLATAKPGTRGKRAEAKNAY